LNTEFCNNKEDSIYLKVSIVEPILASCIDGALFSDLSLNLQRAVTEESLKEYLFHLVNGLFITYNGKKRIYLICDYGIDLLRLIYIQKERNIVDYMGLSIKVE
jgi:hypothetical protein